MKYSLKIITGLALLTLLAGCVVSSVYPFYTAKDVCFDPELVGSWEKNGLPTESSEVWRFEKTETQAYKLTVKDQEKQTEFDSHLFKLKEQLFLDVCPRERQDHTLPVHYLFRVARNGSELEMSMLDFDWLKKCIKADPKALRHIIVPRKNGDDVEGDWILTADTAELQSFLLKHEKTEGAFGDTLKMTRPKR